MLAIRASARARGFPCATALTLARHFDVPPPTRLLPIARRLGGFDPGRDGFAFSNSWDMTMADSRRIVARYGWQVDSATTLLADLVVASLSGLPGIGSSVVLTAMDALRPAIREVVAELLQVSIDEQFAMCGGMSFAGLDFFHGGWDVRRFGTTPPVQGDPLRTYILDRHLDSLDANLRTFVEWHLVLHLLPRVAETVAVRALCLTLGIPLPPEVDAVMLTPYQTTVMGWRDYLDPREWPDLIKDGFEAAIGKLEDWAEDLEKGVRSLVEDAVDALTDTLETIGEALVELAGPALKALVDALRALARKLLGALDIEVGGAPELLWRTRTEWVRLRERLARAQPCVLGLIHRSYNLGDHHQVVAIGARDLAGGRHELKLWDNVDPSVVVTWELDFGGNVLSAARKPSGAHGLLGFFVESYTPELPPAMWR